MSGCEPTEVKKLINKSTGETVMLCQHGSHPNIRCNDCFPVALNKMDEVNNASTKSLFERIEALEIFKSAQLVREISAATVFERINLPDIQERIEALEQERDKGVERLKKLEEENEKLHKRITYICESIYEAYKKYDKKIEALESQQNPVTDVAQEPTKLATGDKTVTIYEAIKAFREGKRVKRMNWTDGISWLDRNDLGSTDDEHLLVDDWIIKDE